MWLLWPPVCSKRDSPHLTQARLPTLAVDVGGCHVTWGLLLEKGLGRRTTLNASPNSVVARVYRGAVCSLKRHRKSHAFTLGDSRCAKILVVEM